MSIENVMKQNLLNEIDNYMMQILYIKDVNTVLEHIEKLENSRLEQSPNFNLISSCALYDSLTLSLSRLYDDDKSSNVKTISQLISKIKKNLQFFDDKNLIEHQIAQWKEKIKSDEYISPTIKVLHQRRDTLYAHNDKKYFGKNITKDTTYLPNYGLWFLIDFTYELLSFLCDQLSDAHYEKRACKYDNDLEKSLIELHT